MTRFFAIAAILFAGVAANAATTVSVTETPTPNVPGNVTYTLTAISDAGDISGFDFVGNGTNFGFFGPMNQVNPAGNASVFTDANGFFGFVGADILDDSQFLLASGDGTVVGADETANSLQAAIDVGTVNAISGPFAFAQISAPIGQEVTFAGTFTVITGSGAILENVSGSLGVIIPEPTSAALLALGLAGVAARRRS